MPRGPIFTVTHVAVHKTLSIWADITPLASRPVGLSLSPAQPAEPLDVICGVAAPVGPDLLLAAKAATAARMRASARAGRRRVVIGCANLGTLQRLERATRVLRRIGGRLVHPPGCVRPSRIVHESTLQERGPGSVRSGRSVFAILGPRSRGSSGSTTVGRRRRFDRTLRRRPQRSRPSRPRVRQRSEARGAYRPRTAIAAAS